MGMMRETMKTESTMGMINTIKTISFGILMGNKLDFTRMIIGWIDNKYPRHEIITHPRFIIIANTRDFKHNALHSSVLVDYQLHTHHTTPLVDLLTRSRSLYHSTISFTHLSLTYDTTPHSSLLSISKYSNRDTIHQYTIKHPTNSHTNCHLNSIMSCWMILTDCQYSDHNQ